MEKNEHTLHRLLRFAALVLRQRFTQKWKQQTGSRWSAGALATHFPGLSLQKIQSRQVSDGEPKDWDITLLALLLCKIPWKDKLPKASKRAINDIRHVRNQVHHAGHSSFADDAFETFFSKVQSALIVLGAKADSIRQIRNPDLKNTEQAAKALSEAIAYKEEGNRAFRAQRFEEACTKYSHAIALAGLIPAIDLAKLYANRSTSYLRLGESKQAVLDAEQATRAAPEWAKGHHRLANALKANGDLERACGSLERAVSLCQNEPENVQHKLQNELWECRELARKRRGEEELRAGYGASKLFGATKDRMHAASGRVNVNKDIMRKLFPSKDIIQRAFDALSDGRHSDGVALLTRAVTEFKDPEAMFYLASCVGEGTGTTKDLARSAALLEEAIRCSPMRLAGSEISYIGITHAHNALALMHNEGVVYDRNPAMALFHWRLSATLATTRSTGACGSGANNLGVIFMDGTHGQSRDAQRARELFLQAVDTGGLSEAMLNLASLNWNERKDGLGALRWCETARRVGDLTVSQHVHKYKQLMEEDKKLSQTLKSMPAECQLQLTEYVQDEINLRQQIRQDTSPVSVSVSPLHAVLRTLPQPSEFVQRLLAIVARFREASSTSVNPIPIVARALCIPNAELILGPYERVMLSVIAQSISCSWSESVDHAIIAAWTADSVEAKRARLGKLHQQYPTNPFFPYWLGMMMCFPTENGEEQDWMHAVDLFNRCLQLCTASKDSDLIALVPEVHYCLGVAYNMAIEQNADAKSTYVQRSVACFERFIQNIHGMGHRKEPTAHYFIGVAQLLYEGNKTSARQHFETGLKLEAALPECLREPNHPRRVMLASLLNPHRRDTYEHKHKHAASSNNSTIPTSNREQQRFGGHVLVPPSGAATMDNVGQACKNDLRLVRARSLECMLKIATSAKQIHSSIPGCASSILRPCDQESSTQWSPICIDEMLSAYEDKVFFGRRFECVVVAPALQLASHQFVVEDCYGDAITLSVYNPSEMKTNIAVGNVVHVLNPYIRVTGNNVNVRVDCPSQTLRITGEHHFLCWNCSAVLEVKQRCGKCMLATYCSRECQQTDWTQFGHKYYCKLVRMRSRNKNHVNRPCVSKSALK